MARTRSIVSTARRRAAGLGIAAVCVGALVAGCSSSSSDSAETDDANLLTAATAWRVTAAERDMLYRQGFNIAQDRVDAALAAPHDKPLAIITDIDDTVLSSDGYWTQLIAAGKQSFDDELWDSWVAANGPTATPGAVEFANYVASKGVQIFYISSRDQGEETQAIGEANLAHVGLPFADGEHVTMLRDSSNKEPAQ